MSKFNDLGELDRIQYIKDGFILILEQLAKDPSKLKNYIKLDKPKLSIPVHEQIKEGASAEEIKAITLKNKALDERTEEQNSKLEAAYKAEEESYKKIEAIVSKLEKKKSCICGSCINVNIINNTIPPELEKLIDIARKEAEEKIY